MDSKSILEETARRIGDLQRKRASLLREVQEVEQELQKVQVTHARLSNERASVSKLPHELLTNIFYLCQAVWVTSSPKGRGRPFKMVAAHVSHHWREVATGTPLLWNVITVVTPRGKKTGRHALERLIAHLTWSHGCLLDIYLDIASSGVVQDYVPVEKYLEAIVLHSSRWRRLSITHAGRSSIYPLFTDVAAPALEHLSMDIRPMYDDLVSSPRTEYSAVHSPILTRGAPLLSFVRISGMIFGDVEPPLSAVTTLHVDSWPRTVMTHGQFRAMLMSLPRLTNLSLTGLNIHLPRDPFIDCGPTIINTLRSLRIRGRFTPCHRLLSLMTLPYLESLFLHGVDTFDSITLPTLRSITLEACIFTETEIRNLFKAFPGVVDLSTDCSFPVIFEILRLDMSLWGSLETMTLREMHVRDVVLICLLAYGRAEKGLRLIRLDRRSRSVMKEIEYSGEVRNFIDVEDCDELDPWPCDLGYEDPDDVYWSGYVGT